VSTIQIIATPIAVLAAIVAIAGAVTSYRANRELRALNRTFTAPHGDGVITVPMRMSDAEHEALRASWQGRYGKREAACGCRNGVRCVKHCTCRHCTAQRRASTNSKEQPGA